MKEKICRAFFSLLIIAIVIFQFTILARATENISNDLISWGLKRSQNHKQPELDDSSLRILEKYDGIVERMTGGLTSNNERFCREFGRIIDELVK